MCGTSANLLIRSQALYHCATEAAHEGKDEQSEYKGDEQSKDEQSRGWRRWDEQSEDELSEDEQSKAEKSGNLPHDPQNQILPSKKILSPLVWSRMSGDGVQ